MTRRRYDKSNAFFARAKKTIPLASQTFSKSSQQWVEGAAPLFLQSGKGCRVTDLDGNTYIDYVMGLLPVVLGYCDPDVDKAIRAQLDEGITFSLAHPKEAALAERLVELIPCAEMVRFGKNGSDVTTGAIRLARAHTGRSKVAICGYHGWHDWYIGTTTRSLGVPDGVRDLSATFPYNDAAALERLLKAEPESFAAVILEAGGTQVPAPGFLQRLRELTTKYGVVLVFDEVITGFRLHLAGAQAHYGVTPDLACFGKAMGNGMPISALVGRAEIMQKIEDIFFSTTFGGEVLSIAAALATIDKLQHEDVIARLWRRGEQLRDGATATLRQRGLGEFVSFAGEGWWPRIKIGKAPVAQNLLISLLRQEFNANGLLLGASFNLSLAHDNDAVMQETISAIDTAAGAVRDALDSPDPTARLRGKPVQPTFAVR
jgi:glutamate-1-semialdehyde 2,1-aminomutase